MQLNTHVTAWAQAVTWLAFLSVSPSLDFIGIGADVDAGVDVGADADAGVGVGAVSTGTDAVVIGVGFGAGVAGVAVVAATPRLPRRLALESARSAVLASDGGSNWAVCSKVYMYM